MTRTDSKAKTWSSLIRGVNFQIYQELGSSSGLATTTPKVPVKLLHGPWTEDKLYVLPLRFEWRWLLQDRSGAAREYRKERMDGWMEAITEEDYQAVELIERVWSMTVRWQSRLIAQAAHRTSETRSHRKRVPKENRRIPLSASASGNVTIGHRSDWPRSGGLGRNKKKGQGDGKGQWLLDLLQKGSDEDRHTREMYVKYGIGLWEGGTSGYGASSAFPRGSNDGAGSDDHRGGG